VASQAEQLLAWAAAWPERTWAAGGASGLGNLLAQQLVTAGEVVLDVQPKMAARVRLLAAGNTNKNDPNDARSVAVAALRSAAPRRVTAEDHTAVLKVWSKRYRDLGRTRTQVACRLHAVLADLVPGGFSREITAGQAASMLKRIRPSGPAARGRRELAAEFLADLRRLDAQIRGTRNKLAAAVQASGTTVTGIFGVGPVIAAAILGHAGRRVPVRRPGPVRRLQRHRPDRGVLRRAEDPPALAARQPAAQPRHPHGRNHPDPVRPQPRPRPLRPQAHRRQDRQGSAPVPQAANQRRHLRPPRRQRRPPRHARPS
jgi:hypothetical protein